MERTTAIDRGLGWVLAAATVASLVAAHGPDVLRPRVALERVVLFAFWLVIPVAFLVEWRVTEEVAPLMGVLDQACATVVVWALILGLALHPRGPVRRFLGAVLGALATRLGPPVRVSPFREASPSTVPAHCKEPSPCKAE